MNKGELSESPKHIGLGVPSVIEIKPTTRELSRDLEEAARQLADVLVDTIVRDVPVPRDMEEMFRQQIGDIVEDYTQKMQETLRPLIQALGSEKDNYHHHHVVVVEDVDEVFIGNHDTIRNNEMSSGKPKKWTCAICKARTRYVCSHPSCQAWERRKGLFGTPLCDRRTGKNNANDNGLSCLEIHRNRLRKEQAVALMHQPM